MSRAQKVSSIGSSQIDEGILATPAVADGALYFRSNRHLWKVGNEMTRVGDWRVRAWAMAGGSGRRLENPLLLNRWPALFVCKHGKAHTTLDSARDESIWTVAGSIPGKMLSAVFMRLCTSGRRNAGALLPWWLSRSCSKDTPPTVP